MLRATVFLCLGECHSDSSDESVHDAVMNDAGSKHSVEILCVLGIDACCTSVVLLY